MKWLFVFVTIFFVLSPTTALAVYDPLSIPNNRVGVHVLSPDELIEASKLVNNDNKGAWGYVTVPIQSTDRDRTKWTAFMKKATELKVIPIIRVATLGDGPRWLKPQDDDLIDFANFLSDLPWPTQNHYVVVFNEVNRADEYGGTVSPEDYADILYNAIDIFKRRSDKFFILPSAMDNAAPNSGNFMRWDVYLKRMYAHRPEVFERIDGWNSHAYGNPGFSSSPALSGYNKADSFKSDLELVKQFTKRKLPVFITEAGWSRQVLDDRQIATFYNHAFYNIWSNNQVVAVTPFLLYAGTQPFQDFSLLNKNRQPTEAYGAIKNYATAGNPQLEIYETPTSSATPAIGENAVAEKTASDSAMVLGETSNLQPKSIWQKITEFLVKLFHFDYFTKTATVGEKTYQTELVTSLHDVEVGLAKYDKLAENHAMLFDLKTKRIQTFWMKNMKFDIDIVWINDDKVIGINQGYAKTPYDLIKSQQPANYVLEVNQNSGIKVGDRVKIN